MENEKSCRQRWRSSYESRIEDIREIVKEIIGPNDNSEDRLLEYGLSWEWVPQEGKQAGYFRWLLSWGGPSCEFRFYPDEDNRPAEIEYWFLDWDDGYGQKVDQNDEDVLLWVYDFCVGGDYAQELMRGGH